MRYQLLFLVLFTGLIGAGIILANNSPTPEMSPKEYQEVENSLRLIVQTEDPRAALKKLESLVAKNPKILKSCHPLTHELGAMAYEKYQNFSETAQYATDLCNSGFIHGVLEQYLPRQSEPYAIESICGQFPEKKYQSWQCFHGAGHGLMLATQNNLPKSLQTCKNHQSDFARSVCVNGVFMENFNTEQKAHPSRYLKADDWFYPCNDMALEYKTNCYVYTPIRFLQEKPGKYREAIRWCKTAENDYIYACFRGLGGQIFKENPDRPKFVESMCGKAAEMNGECIAGMTDWYILHSGNTESAQELCRKLKTSNRPPCADAAASVESLF